MNPNIRKALRTGAIFGVVICFLVLIGFTVIASDILGDFLDIQTDVSTGNDGALVLLFGLLGLWAGASALLDYYESSWLAAATSGLIAGATSGLITALFALLLGEAVRSGTNLRPYLAELSPGAIRLFIHGEDPAVGALINLGVLTAGGLAGALLRKLWRSLRSQDRITSWRKTGDTWIENSTLQTQPGRRNLGRWLLYGLLLAVVLVIPQYAGNYWNFILGTVGIYVLMGLGLNIVVGMAGLLDLGYVAFFAVGAYTIGLLTSPTLHGLQWSFWSALPAGILLAGFAGILLGIPVLRLRGDYLAIVTLGFGEIIRVLVRSDMLAKFSGGPQGVRNIAGPVLFGESLRSEREFIYFIIIGILIVIFVTNRLQSSRVGRAWIAMREDETVAQAMGINTYQAKLLAFAIGAAFAGLGGVLFASRNQYTGPEDHALLVSINVLALVIVGGMGSIPGVILGAFALKGLPEILREIEDYRILAFGALLVVMMIWRPEGLWPSKRRSLEVHTKEEVVEVAPAEPVHPTSTDVPPLAEPDATTDVTISTDTSPR